MVGLTFATLQAFFFYYILSLFLLYFPDTLLFILCIHNIRLTIPLFLAAVAQATIVNLLASLARW